MSLILKKIILFVTVFGENVTIYYGIIFVLIFLALKLILSQEIKQCYVMKNVKYFELEDDSQQAIKTLENTIARLSINLYRASVFTITSVAIIGMKKIR